MKNTENIENMENIIEETLKDTIQKLKDVKRTDKTVWLYLVFDKDAYECGIYANTEKIMNKAIEKHPSLVGYILDYYEEEGKYEIATQMRNYTVTRMNEFEAHQEWLKARRKVKDLEKELKE